MGSESPGRATASFIWLLVVSLAGSILLFDGSQDGSLVGGRFPSAILWPVLWLGTMSVRRPPIVHDLVAAAIAFGGIPFVLITPSVDVSAFLGVTAMLWATLALSHMSVLHAAADETGDVAR